MTTKPTAQELLTAADTLERFSQGIAHSPTDYQWSANDLRTEAQHRAEEEREEAEREKLVEELAADLNSRVGLTSEQVARKLIDAGWRKGE